MIPVYTRKFKKGQHVSYDYPFNFMGSCCFNGTSIKGDGQVTGIDRRKGLVTMYVINGSRLCYEDELVAIKKEVS